MNNKALILGIDFSSDFSQLAFLNDAGEPESISVGQDKHFLVPTVMFFNDELKEWSVGEEAINRSQRESGKVVTNLPEALFYDELKEQNRAMMKAYIAYFVKLAANYTNGQIIKSIVMTVDDLTVEIMECFYEAIEALGYKKENTKILSHSESFIYYVLNQHKDVWVNNVLMLDFSQQGLVYRRLSIRHTREAHIADVETKKLDDVLTFDNIKTDIDEADKILEDFMDEELNEHVISAVYFSGEGFYSGDWKNTLKKTCNNRRVFKGNNLIVKGAVYGAKELFYISNFSDYIISCKGRTKVNVSMEVNHQGSEKQLVLSKIGTNWYEAGAVAECILDKPTIAKFTIQSPITKESENFFIDLQDFPARKNKTVRIRIKFAYINENKFAIEIKDIGFGEFYESSGKVVREEVTV